MSKRITVNAHHFIKMYEALKEIARYQTPEQLQRDSKKDWGLDYEESLAMAYDNIQQTAKDAVKGISMKRVVTQLKPATTPHS
jgi:hypothetical protein